MVTPVDSSSVVAVTAILQILSSSYQCEGEENVREAVSTTTVVLMALLVLAIATTDRRNVEFGAAG